MIQSILRITLDGTLIFWYHRNRKIFLISNDMVEMDFKLFYHKGNSYANECKLWLFARADVKSMMIAGRGGGYFTVQGIKNRMQFYDADGDHII